MGIEVMTNPSRTRLLDLFIYDPATGELRRRKTVKGAAAGIGETPGYVEDKGYRRIRVDGVRYRAGSLIWLMMTGEWPASIVDHIDTYGPKADWGDRWENLRLATRSQNSSNQRIGCRNNSGVLGVSWGAAQQRWRAQLKVRSRTVHLGWFTDKDAAIAARRAAEINYFGEFRPVPPATTDWAAK